MLHTKVIILEIYFAKYAIFGEISWKFTILRSIHPVWGVVGGFSSRGGPCHLGGSGASRGGSLATMKYEPAVNLGL